MAVHSLGPFNFVTLTGPGDRGEPPTLLQRTAVPIQRAGVNGTAFVRTGIKAQPSWLRSGIDCIHQQHADALITAYKSLEAGNAQPIVWNDVDFQATYNCLYVVLEVRVIQCIRLSAAAGGLSSNSTRWLECAWLVNPVMGT